jgi:glycosyltransferase involved in cell wall biosynthesis
MADTTTVFSARWRSHRWIAARLSSPMSRPLRICFVATGLSIGGAETTLFRVATRLDRARFEPMIVSLMDDRGYAPDFRAAGIPVTSLGFTNRLPTPARFVRLIESIREFRPDVMMGWMYHGNLAASLGRRWAAPRAGLAWNIRHSVYDLANERFVTRNLIRLGGPLSRHVDATVYVSHVSMRQHIALGYAAHSALVIDNGIDPPAVPTAAERSALRAELGIAPTDVVIGHVARFHPMKDHVTFLRAAQFVARADANARVLLIGNDVDASNPVLRPLLTSPDLAGRVTTLGERRDVFRLLGAMDIFCLSSSSESFPNVVLEAAASGLPCVVTNVGAAPDIAGASSIVVQPRNPRALADGLLELCRIGAGGRRDRGAAARAFVLGRYSMESVVDTYSALLEDLSPRSTTPGQVAAPRDSTVRPDGTQRPEDTGAPPDAQAAAGTPTPSGDLV